MKISALLGVSALTAAVLIFPGCKPALPPGAVSFAGSGMALIPGENWQQIREGQFTSGSTICLPVLKGQGPLRGSLIQVQSTAVNASVQSAAAMLRTKIAAMPEASQDSVKQEDFVAGTGIRGIQVYYDFTVTEGQKVIRLRAHDYLFQNKKGHCIGINYVTFADGDSEAVQEMILKTLVLE